MSLHSLCPLEAVALLGSEAFGFNPLTEANAIWFTDSPQTFVAGIIQTKSEATWRYAIVGCRERGLRWLGGGFGFATSDEARQAMERRVAGLTPRACA